MVRKIEEFHIVRIAVVSAALLVLAARGAPSQEATQTPEFEVASVKLAEPMPAGRMVFAGCRTPDPERFVCNAASFRMLVLRAYGVKTYQVSGPGWMDSERYEIAAKIPSGASPEQVNLMLQKLLVDRFQVSVHRETKDVPVYALVVGKNGHKLKESKTAESEPPADANPAGQGAPRRVPGGVTSTMHEGIFEIAASEITVPILVNMLSNQVDRPVLDETGLTGKYDFTLSFAFDPASRLGVAVTSATGGSAPGMAGSDAAAGPSIFSAVQSQLGLKLEPKKASMDVVVVDKAGKVPTAN
jgi:uncharacterized protein (TIGR03435 family)